MSRGERYFLTDQLFDRNQIATFFRRAERNCKAFSTSAACSANAVNIAFRLSGKIVIHDVSDTVDVDASSGDVGRDKNIDLFCAECFERSLSSTL